MYSPSVKVQIIRSTSTPDYVGTGYVKVYDKLNSLGVDAMRSTDDAKQIGSEIALGETNRAASVSAKALVDGSHKAGNITFANYYNYNGESGATPNISFDVINLRFTSASIIDLYVDNVSIVSE